MSLWHIAWSYMWSRRLTTALTVFSVALAVGLISALLTIRSETRQRFEEEQQAYDVVVGEGSPLQLTLNAVYLLDQPSGQFPYSDYLRLKAHESVVHAFPVNLGDTYRGYRIAGVVPEMFDFVWTIDSTGEERHPFQLEDGGRLFEKPMEAVIGYLVARNTQLKVGDKFKGTHGSIELPDELNPHADDEYEVVGVLKPSGTSNDRGIFVSLESVWELHEEFGGNTGDGEGNGSNPDEKYVTAVLIDLWSSTERFSFSDYVRNEFRATAAIPVMQILRLYEQILAPAVVILRTVGYVVVVISAISILVGLYLSIIQRKRDLAIMRALGASAYEIFGAVMIEAFLVTVLGIASGWVLGKGVSVALGIYMSRAYGFAITGLSTGPEEIGFFGAVAFVGLLAGILPAWQAYQTDVAKDLAEP